jgi:hypothetical protein
MCTMACHRPPTLTQGVYRAQYRTKAGGMGVFYYHVWLHAERTRSLSVCCAPLLAARCTACTALTTLVTWSGD